MLYRAKKNEHGYVGNEREGKRLCPDFVSNWRGKIFDIFGYSGGGQDRSPGSDKNWSLEGLRGLACISVVNAHFIGVFYPILCYYFQPPSPWPSPNTLVERILSHPPFTLMFHGHFAVSIFFALSGYVLTAKYFKTLDPTLLRQGAIKRYPRLVLPALASIMLVYFLLLAGQMKNHLAGNVGAGGWILEYYKEPASLISSLYAGLFGAPILGDSRLNNPLWTLKIELIGSLLLFTMYYIFELKHKSLLIFWFILFSVALSHGPMASFYYLTILFGSLIHLVADQLNRRPKLAFAIFIAGLIAGAYDFSPRFALLRSIDLPAFFRFAAEFNANKCPFYWALGGVLTVAGVVGSPLLRRIFAIRLFRYFGKISFSLYLLHWPIIFSFSISMVKKGIHFKWERVYAVLFSYVLTCAVLVIASSLFYRLVDSPSIRLASRIEKRISSGKAVIEPHPQ